MTTLYRVVERLNEGLVAMTHPRYGKQLWARRKLRKPRECRECGRMKKVGATMFGAITNGYNRMDRLCPACVGRL